MYTTEKNEIFGEEMPSFSFSTKASANIPGVIPYDESTYPESATAFRIYDQRYRCSINNSTPNAGLVASDVNETRSQIVHGVYNPTTQKWSYEYGDFEYSEFATSYTYEGKTVYFAPYITASPDIPNGVEFTSTLTAAKYAWVMVFGGYAQPFNPDPAGYSDEAGGDGDFDGTSDPVDFPSLPTITATDTGFITLFNPTLTQLNNLASYMWTNPLFDLSAWKKLYADPMDAILGLSIVPVDVPSAGTSVVTVGNIPTDVIMTKAASQYVEVDCGSISVNEYWGAYLDYAPYTKAELYLPYCGTHPIDIDEIMGKTVHVKYHVDILSGACCAYVQCGGSVLYTFIGQCASSIPVSGGDWTNMINGLISVASSVGSMVASGGATAPTAIPALASTAINSMKPTVEKSGAISGSGALLAIQNPYLILSRPRQALAENQNSLIGYPSFITETLSNLRGYTEIETIHLENVLATDEEINEIISLLKSGVIF